MTKRPLEEGNVDEGPRPEELSLQKRRKTTLPAIGTDGSLRVAPCISKLCFSGFCSEITETETPYIQFEELDVAYATRRVMDEEFTNVSNPARDKPRHKRLCCYNAAEHKWEYKIWAEDLQKLANTVGHNAIFPIRSLSCSYRIRLGLRIEAGSSSSSSEPPNTIASNSEQPPNFKRHPLRPEQLRSLLWMKTEEEKRSNPFSVDFVLTDFIHCACMDYELQQNYGNLGLMSTARHRNPNTPLGPHCRDNVALIDVRVTVEFDASGGIIADPIGFGKTATALGLIDSDGAPPQNSMDLSYIHRNREYHHSKGTLVVVPANLTFQWLQEIAKFLLPPEETISESTLARAMQDPKQLSQVTEVCGKVVIYIDSVVKLKKYKAFHFRRADIVMCSIQVFNSTAYQKETVLQERARYRNYVDTPRKSEPLHLNHDRYNYVLLQDIFWRRIIVDEVHELSQLAEGPMRIIQSLQAHYHWGLSGSLNLTTDGICDISPALGIELAIEPDIVASAETISSFVQRFISRSPKETLNNIPVEEHLINVKLNQQERALYMDSCKGQNRETLIGLCCNFNTGNRRTTSPEQEIEFVLGAKVEEIDRTWQLFNKQLIQELRNSDLTKEKICHELADVFEKITYKEALQGIVESIEDNADIMQSRRMRRKARATATDQQAKRSSELNSRVFKKTELAKCIQSYIKASGSWKFLETTLDVLQKKKELRTCIICYAEDLDLSKLVLTTCAHVYCMECVTELKNHSGFKQCSFCRHPLGEKDVFIVPDNAVNAASPSDRRFLSYGSKMYAIWQKLSEIRKCDPTAKVILFTQWEWLRNVLRKVLTEFQIPFCVMEGSSAARTKTLDGFQNNPDAKEWVMLMELNSASGCHITSANHVMLVHPMDCDTPQEAAAYEAQAIGRCKRVGQTKTVHVWRFVAESTVEEELTAMHRAAISSNFS